MRYQKFVKDYAVTYVTVPGRKRLKAVRVYTGPYFRFTAPPERIRLLRWFYLIGMILTAALLVIPMCVDCPFTRTWYIQVPAAAAWIPLVLAAGAVWRLWTAEDKVDREHCELLFNRMSSATVCLAVFCAVSLTGCVVQLIRGKGGIADWLVSGCCLCSTVGAAVLFIARKDLKMEQVK